MGTGKQLLYRVLVIVLFNLCIIGMVNAAYARRAEAPGGTISVLSRVGSRGAEVTRIQQRLAELGYSPGAADGIYGNATAEAVRAFQQDNGLAADGVAGPDTLRVLGVVGGTGGSPGGQAVGGVLSGVYRQGEQGDGVRQIQAVLADLGYYTANIDGVFGAGLARAVRDYQRNKGLSADGVVGAATLRSLGLAGSSLGDFSDTDLQLLARLVSAEARGEPYSGQVAVAAVILNRIRHPSFPDTLYGVAYQPDAFTAITNGQIKEPVAESAYRAAKDALNGSDPSGGAVHYYNPKKTYNQWLRTRPVIKTIGGHVFCA